MKTCLQYPRGPLLRQPGVLLPPPCRFDGSSRLFSPTFFRQGRGLPDPPLFYRGEIKYKFTIPRLLYGRKKCTFYKRYNCLLFFTINTLDCCGKFQFLLYSDPFSSSLEGFPRFSTVKFHVAVPATRQIGGLVWIIRGVGVSGNVAAISQALPSCHNPQQEGGLLQLIQASSPADRLNLLPTDC